MDDAALLLRFAHTMPLVRPYSSVHLPTRIPTGVFMSNDGGPPLATIVPFTGTSGASDDVGIGESIMMGVGATWNKCDH